MKIFKHANNHDHSTSRDNRSHDNINDDNKKTGWNFPSRKFSKKKLYSRSRIAILFIMSTLAVSTIAVKQGQAFSLKELFGKKTTTEQSLQMQTSTNTSETLKNKTHKDGSVTVSTPENEFSSTKQKNESLNASQTSNTASALNTSQTLNASPTTYKIYYYLQDHLGNVTHVLDEHGNLLEVKDYLPFGGTNVDETYGDYKSDYVYNDKEKDPEADLYYYGARYYNDSTSKFTSIDPALFNQKKLMKRLKNPQSLNSYSYALNNPILFVDINGEDANVTIKDNVATVSTTIYIYGDDASKENAEKIQKNIMDSWSKDQNGNPWKYTDEETGNVYDVVFDIKVVLYDESDTSKEPGFFEVNNPLDTNNHINLNENTERPYVLYGDRGEWNLESAVHEFGHLIGLGDKYIDGVSPSGNMESFVVPSWADNIMGTGTGKVEQRNINAFMSHVIDSYNDSWTKFSNNNFNTNFSYTYEIDLWQPRW